MPSLNCQTCRSLLLMALSLFVTHIAPVPESCAGQEKQPAADYVIHLKVEKDQSIRDISKKYLNDPNRWEDLLRENDLDSPHQVVPGMTLVIPAGIILKTKKLIEETEVSISRATEAGAMLFASRHINMATNFNKEAVEKQKSGLWQESILASESARKEAQTALELSLEKHNVKAEAIIDFREGEVHRKKPSDNQWDNVALKDVLTEHEKIRTLSQSTADILFKDGSRLHMEENAQARIRKMRSNLLENTEEAEVSLIEGDVLALLAGRKGKKSVKIAVKGIETKINSSRYWVGTDKKTSRYANYDGEIEISSAGKKVLLKKNQGSIVFENQKPSAPIKLLPSPRLIRPDNHAALTDAKTGLFWEKIEGAIEYRVEFSDDISFSKVLSRFRTTETNTLFPDSLIKKAKELVERESLFFQVYWRIAAISSDGLPGRPSSPRSIRITIDNTPPYLVVKSPVPDAVLTEPLLIIKGKTEADAIPMIRGKQVAINDEGIFTHSMNLVPGNNLIEITAKDAAGNISTIQRKVMVISENDFYFNLSSSNGQSDTDLFVINKPVLPLSGKTLALAHIKIKSVSGPFSVQSHADKEGRFEVEIPINSAQEKFDVEATSLSGKKKHTKIDVRLDETPPIIKLDDEIPQAVKEKKLSLAGTVEDGISLAINETQVPLEKKRFKWNMDLAPGSNNLSLTARDPAGNTSKIVKTIEYDADPPALVGHKISKKIAKGGENIRIKIEAADATGLTKAALYSLSIGKRKYSGHLIRSDKRGEYTGLFKTPKHAKGKIKLLQITLTDYLGNRKTYILDK